MAFALLIIAEASGHRRQGDPLRGLAPLGLDPGRRTPPEALRRAKARNEGPCRPLVGGSTGTAFTQNY